ncbi:hypothetical protein [Riemerella columbina]|uniref:hypothetical protein n=1 Tax=Riemerella columbina TaxID=103810 RepID=UPI0003730C02|nr:hypothetical protein [Riemerella columbina]
MLLDNVMKKAYYYFYLYKSIEYTAKFFEETPSFLLFKSSIVFMALQIWSILSVIGYYSFFIKIKPVLSMDNPVIILILILILGFNFYTIDYNNKAIKYIEYFDRVKQNNHKSKSFIILFFVLFIIANFIFSLYLVSSVD